MKPYQRVASRYMKAKYQKGNITIDVSTDYAEYNSANLGVELKVDGEYMGHCEAHVAFYTLEEMGRGHFVCADDIEKLTEEYWFEDLEVDELFWQTNKPKEEQIPWRKTSLTEGRNLKTQKIYNFDRKTKVFQKI